MPMVDTTIEDLISEYEKIKQELSAASEQHAKLKKAFDVLPAIAEKDKPTALLGAALEAKNNKNTPEHRKLYGKLREVAAQYSMYLKQKYTYLTAFSQIVRRYKLDDIQKEQIKRLTGIDRKNMIAPDYSEGEALFASILSLSMAMGLSVIALIIWYTTAQIIFPLLIAAVVLLVLGVVLYFLNTPLISLGHNTFKTPFLSEELLEKPCVDDQGKRHVQIELSGSSISEENGRKSLKPLSRGEELYAKATYFDVFSIWAGMKKIELLDEERGLQIQPV